MQGSLSEQEGVDLVHLCATFSANPFIMAFAQVPVFLQWCVQYASILRTLYRRSLEICQYRTGGLHTGVHYAADECVHHSMPFRKALHAANILIIQCWSQ